MSAQTYKITSEAGAEHFGHVEGSEVELILTPDRELAYVCAGWIEPVNKKAKGD